MSASGFQWIHKHLEEYSPLPFYLFSGRDRSFINKKYADYDWEMEGDYFFSPNENIESKRNRYYHLQDLDELLNNIEEEVSNIATSEFKIRQEFSKAFKTINKFKLDGQVFIDILLSDESLDRYKLINKANPLRMVIESFISKLEEEYIIPKNYPLNSLHELLKGNDNKYKTRYSSQHYMHKSLADAYKFFIDYTQDGSHDKNWLHKDFKDYLRKSRDTYIVKSLAIIGLDIINWLGDLYNDYIEYKPFKESFKAVVKEIKTVKNQEGAIVTDDLGQVYFIKQANGKYKYIPGSNIEVFDITTTTKEFGDFYAKGKNLDIKD